MNANTQMEYLNYIIDKLKVMGIDPDPILKFYNEDHRHYHNMGHIIYMLDNAVKNEIQSDELFLAIVFHDLIYDPKSNMNEEYSAIHFMKMMEGNITSGLDQEQIHSIRDAILETKTHKPTTKLSEQLSYLDLMVLDDEINIFKQFEDRIREEYSFVPVEIYRTERIRILKELGVKQEYLDYVISLYK